MLTDGQIRSNLTSWNSEQNGNHIKPNGYPRQVSKSKTTFPNSQKHEFILQSLMINTGDVNQAALLLSRYMPIRRK